MKKLAIVLGVLVSGLSFAAPQTYALKCRSGESTNLLLNIAGDLRFAFQKASMAAGAQGQNLRPGQCAFVDRAIGANEPGLVVAKTGPNFKVGVFMPNNQSNLKGYMYAEKQGWVYDFTTKDTILTIYVYNDGQVLRAPNP